MGWEGSKLFFIFNFLFSKNTLESFLNNVIIDSWKMNCDYIQVFTW